MDFSSFFQYSFRIITQRPARRRPHTAAAKSISSVVLMIAINAVRYFEDWYVYMSYSMKYFLRIFFNKTCTYCHCVQYPRKTIYLIVTRCSNIYAFALYWTRINNFVLMFNVPAPREHNIVRIPRSSGIRHIQRTQSLVLLEKKKKNTFCRKIRSLKCPLLRTVKCTPILLQLFAFRMPPV